jgi:polysaccharide deacetylase family protein (PEP-CTERM system associated)
MNPIYLTVDFEDHTENYDLNGRYAAMTYRLLNLFRENNRRATFFTVGRMAKAAPSLIHEVADEGHEIAYHSHAHLSLTEESPEIFRRETFEDKGRIEQITGKPLLGFRAPRFSLMPKTLWAVDILQDLGFSYSSSVMPTALSRFGFPKAPSMPFLWKNGLMEFPLPVRNLGLFRIPYSGGIYLYAMPFFLTKKLLAGADPEDVVWTYMHPYDFDTQSPMKTMPNTPFWVRALLSLAGKRAPAQVKNLIALCGTSKQTLGDLAGDKPFRETLARFFP